MKIKRLAKAFIFTVGAVSCAFAAAILCYVLLDIIEKEFGPIYALAAIFILMVCVFTYAAYKWFYYEEDEDEDI